MAIEFPEVLGNCLTKSFSYSDQDADRLFTPMESGIKRRRQLTKNIPSEFGALFLFDLNQLGVFDYFNQNILLSMTLEFEIILKTGQGLVTKTVKHSQPPSIKRIGNKYEVFCNFETIPS